MLARIAAHVVVGGAAPALCRVWVHLHDRVAAFAARASHHDDGGVAVALGRGARFGVALMIERNVDDGVGGTLHVRHGAGHAARVTRQVGIKIPQIGVDFDAFFAERRFQVDEILGAPVESARAAGAHVDLLGGKRAEQVDLFRACRKRQHVVLVLHHDQTGCLLSHGEFVGRGKRRLSVGRLCLPSERKSDQSGVSGAQHVDDDDGCDQDDRYHYTDNADGLALCLHFLLLLRTMIYIGADGASALRIGENIIDPRPSSFKTNAK